jgi:hypothetical protein
LLGWWRGGCFPFFREEEANKQKASMASDEDGQACASCHLTLPASMQREGKLMRTALRFQKP